MFVSAHIDLFSDLQDQEEYDIFFVISQVPYMLATLKILIAKKILISYSRLQNGQRYPSQQNR